MTKPSQQPKRGESAWLAAKQEMARRNDAARARGAARHAAYEAQRMEARRRQERLEATDLPEQPHPMPSPERAAFD